MARFALEQQRLVIATTVVASVVLASQLAGKAARDAIFLQQFPVTSLPVMLAVSSGLAIAVTFAFARQLSRGVPGRGVRIANLASAGALLGEWLVFDASPRAIAPVIYLHQSLLGPILVSGFWSLVSEAFDPRSARRAVGTIAAGATVGALAGAVLAERVAALVGTTALLPVIACLQLGVAWRLQHVRGEQPDVPAVPGGGEVGEVVRRIVRVSLLRRLATITVVATVSAALLDYLFKSAVTEDVAAHDLARVFAVFHGVVGVLTAIVAWAVGRWALQAWGLARTLATLPSSVIVFGGLALVLPGLATFVALRGAENVVRNSLYREAYEVFYTPLDPADRRATKTVIDVGVERFGDVLGAVVVLAILAIAPIPTSVLVVGAIGLSAIGLVIALHAQRSYVEALEQRLLAHADELELDGTEPRDRTTRTTLELVAQRSSLARGAFPAASGPAGATRPPDEEASQRELRRIAQLRSGEPREIRRGLADPLTPATVACVIPLLGVADVEADAHRALLAAARACSGQLVDATRDASLPLAVRARLPALIASGADAVAFAGLLACLQDHEFDVRYAAAQALLELHERHPELELDHQTVFEGVRRELAGPARWHSDDGQPSPAAQHLATLLSLALPAEPVRTAFHGLWSDDQAFRGVALEYLENVLPTDIREEIWKVLAIEVSPIERVRRSVDDIRAELLRSHRARGDELEPATN
jgi:ATP:ADP antiporter, AAA family